MKTTFAVASLTVLVLLAFDVNAKERLGQTNKPSLLCATCDTDGGGGSGGSTSAPDVVTYHKIDTLAHTVEMQLDNGSILRIDYPQGKVFISGGGHSAVLSLDTVLLQKANGNTQLASSLKAQLRSKLYKEGLMIELSSLSSNPGFLYQKIGSRKGSQGLMMGPSYPGTNCYSDYYCYHRTFVVDNWGSYGSSFWGLAADPYRGSDYSYWDIWRRDHCNDMNSDFVGAGTAVLSMAVGCPFFATGVGALACAAGGIGVVIEMNSAADNASICLSSYPGVDNWGH